MAVGDYLTETEKAYAAGFLDGEGYIGIKCSTRDHVQKSRSHRVYVSIANKNKEVIAWLHERFEGSVEYDRVRGQGLNQAPISRWRTSAKNAMIFLALVEPYLIVKKSHAHVAMLMQKTICKDNKGKGLDEDTLKLRDACMDRIHVLNKRGVI